MLKKMKVLGLIALIPLAMSFTRPANSLITLGSGWVAGIGWYIAGGVGLATVLEASDGGWDNLTSGMNGIAFMALIPVVIIGILDAKGLPAMDGAEGLSAACGLDAEQASALETYAPMIEGKTQDFMVNLQVDFKRLSDSVYSAEANQKVKDAIRSSVGPNGLSEVAAEAWIQLRECGNNSAQI